MVGACFRFGRWGWRRDFRLGQALGFRLGPAIMNCPQCNQAMSFVPANQNWWCNGGLAAPPCGPTPEGLAGSTTDQVAEQRHQGSHGEIAASSVCSSRMLGSDGVLDIFDLRYLLPCSCSSPVGCSSTPARGGSAESSSQPSSVAPSSSAATGGSGPSCIGAPEYDICLLSDGIR